MIAPPHSSLQNDTSLLVVDDTQQHSVRIATKLSPINTNSKTLRSNHRLPIKKRCFHEMMNDYDDTNIDDMGSCCDPPPTKLRRLVASYWNNNNDNDDDHTLNRYTYDTTIGSTITHKDELKQCYDSPNWKEITKRPPSSGSYIYNETYGEEIHPYYLSSRPTSDDTDDDDDMHCESHRIPTSNSMHATKKKEVPKESCIPVTYTTCPSSPSNDVKPPVELSFEGSEDDMDKKPAALVHYPKDVHVTKHNEYVYEEEEEESIALAPLGPSRRTTAAHDALFSMSPKPVSLEKGVTIQGITTTTTTTMSTAKIAMEHLSIPLTKLSRKDNSFRLGHDSMSYSTDETDQIQRPLPYLSVGMLPKQPPNVLSDTDDEEELLLLTNALPSTATTTVGPDSGGTDHGISLPSVTPSPNVLKQQQFVLKERKQAPLSSSTDHKFHTINPNVIRPTPLKAPPPAMKIEKDVVEHDFLNQVGNLFFPNASISEQRYNAFQPVTKRNNYRALHNIISEMVHIDSPSNTIPNLHPPMETTPIRRTPKTTYKSPFKPISLKEYDHRIYSNQKGVSSTNGKALPPIPRFTPTPTKPKSLYEQYNYHDPSAMITSPVNINDCEEESMEWEHPLRPKAATPTMMMMTDFTPTPPPPQYDIHFTLHGPSKIGPPVPSEVVVVPTTYMTTTTSSNTRKSDSKSIQLTPTKTMIHHLPSPKVMSSKSIVSSKVTKPIHQIHASQVHTTGVLPTTKGKPWTASSNTTNSNSREIPAKAHHSTTYRRTTKTPYVPPAPIEEHPTNLQWDGMMNTPNDHHAHHHPPSIQLPALQRHVASAFAPGQRRGYDENHHHHIHHSWMDTPQDEYSSPHHHHPHKATTNTTIISNNNTNTNTVGPVLDTMTAMQHNYRNGNHNNCMSSCSNSSSGGSSNSNKNSSTGPGHHHHRPNDYEKYEA